MILEAFIGAIIVFYFGRTKTPLEVAIILGFSIIGIAGKLLGRVVRHPA